MKKIWKGTTTIKHPCSCGRVIKIDAPFVIQYFPHMHTLNDRDRGRQLVCGVVPPEYVECRKCGRHFALNDGVLDDYQDGDKLRYFLSQKKRNFLLRGTMDFVEITPVDVARL